MKKKLFYLASLCLALAFTACSSDDGASPAPVQKLTNELVTQQAYTLEFPQTAPFKRVSLTETGRAIVGPIYDLDAAKQRRIESARARYVVGNYVLDNKTVIITQPDGSEYCRLKLAIIAPSTITNVQITMKNGSGIDETVFDGDATVGDKIAADDITSVLCREWTVATTRLRHKGEVKAVMQFEKGKVYEDNDGNPTYYDPASLNDILRYAKSVATINEEFDEETVIESIEFTSSGTFCMLFENGKHYVGEWNWTNKDKGYLHYDWDDTVNMGNKFENGEAVFDIRPFQKQQYYTLTLGATINDDAGKPYEVELSFYLQEKKEAE